MTRGFILDLDRCTGCAACELACTIENRLDPAASWRQIVTFNEPHYEGVPVHHLSLACNHCDEAPCMAACPALAYRRDPGTGAVLLDGDRCIGCGYCAWACPYDAPRFDDASGVMTKCTLCHPRLVDGGRPACVAGCPTDALRFGDLEIAGGSDRARGFPRTSAGPRIRFLRHGGAAGGPPRVPAEAPPAGLRPQAPRIRLRSEWPLALFTLVAAWLTGLLLARQVSGLTVHGPAFVGLALGGMGLSTFHLGRPLRAWRAVLNPTTSWLSREVILYGIFVATGTASLLLLPESALLGWTSVAAGLACLFAMDRVYDLVRDPGRGLHSAEVLPTGLFLGACLAGAAPAALVLGMFRAALYARRKLRDRPALRRGHALAALARVTIGWLGPAFLWWLDGMGPVVLTGIAAGELIDRLEFYGELVVPGPRRQAVLDLQALAAWSADQGAGAEVRPILPTR